MVVKNQETTGELVSALACGAIRTVKVIARAVIKDNVFFIFFFFSY